MTIFLTAPHRLYTSSPLQTRETTRSNCPFLNDRRKEQLPWVMGVRFRRILVIAGRSGEGRFTEPTAAAHPWQREPLKRACTFSIDALKHGKMALHNCRRHSRHGP